MDENYFGEQELTWEPGSLPAVRWWHPIQRERRCHCSGALQEGWRGSCQPATSF